ncbi:acyl-ACP--UDP-N-acetylglucosamine O-acyltransferase [Oceanibacterium hippocampi]|uniref:Acyl-[acyl-carrier-protein]--UDP-N-acetylglucosamine O-acyltransferase n=1 Tax=Oceanibacterium hippocampi TaxID=745714 RepID=A0A1Y5T2T0_9PROT|nr:acyl-ACP--UDP-N-acetylglucosamine O-acyltransferase [Oceanibacterium hippocampi]SLN54123.1 Acyl-[acyl-carrier-protein]--UDP-N-acetylglucosamine O-acyltransferase [Oceanibacterium hippocampi]
MTNIHPTAIIEDGATIGNDVVIGPWCHVGPDVTLGDGTRLESHVAVAGRTRIGASCKVFPFASLGYPPQDLKYRGEPSRLEIGDNNVIREHVTMNPGTEGGGMVTSTGRDCLFMVGAHVAHDCRLGNGIILVNNATLGGHVSVGDYAIIGGLSAVHQFVRVGAHAMIGGMTGVETDVIPFGSVTGNRARLSGLNLTGMKRRGFPREEMHALRSACRMLFDGKGTLNERIETVAGEFAQSAVVADVVRFLRGASDRGVCLPGNPGDL